MNKYIKFTIRNAAIYVNVDRIDYVKWIYEEWNSYLLRIYVGGSNTPFEQRCNLKQLNEYLKKINLPEVKEDVK
jgi:hypothetical protein